MPRIVDISVLPHELTDHALHLRMLAIKLGVPAQAITGVSLLRRSIDARKRPPHYQLQFNVWVNEPQEAEEIWDFPLQNVTNAQPVIIVGCGPAGMFAALRLIELGMKPIVLERGKDVRGRRRDLAAINKDGVVNPESNYCFGEGGAGTFSDGKLYTRSKKRGDTRKILQILMQHGATRDILIDAHPHIGTNKLPQIIESMRETIVAHGGEVHFEKRVDDILVRDGQVAGAVVNGGETVAAKALILATGHSARDIFRMFEQKKWAIESKPFALGVRVEHPQALIDSLQYHCDVRPDGLPAAAYTVSTQAFRRGVYSFCMCPGGIICPASTADDELVVNGWSPSKRDSPFANSGMVVEVIPDDWKRFGWANPLAAMEFQAEIEKACYVAGGGKQVAPAQRLADFVNGKSSSTLPECSYLPGLSAQRIDEILPKEIVTRLKEGFREFGHKMKGYLSNDAVVVATESRTSAPVRIPRADDTLMHPQVRGLFPCGEGAGYAGGIMSAAMDGERCAEAAVQLIIEN
jgi:uncharacterized protein